MTKRNYSIAVSAAIASLIAFAPQAIAGKATSVTVAQEARETLQEVKGLAATATDDADQLQTFSQNPKLSSDAHIAPLWELKRDVNKIGEELTGLDARRESLEPWEQQAIDKVLPLFKDAASSTQSAIDYFIANREHLWNPDYRAYAEKIRNDADQIARMLTGYLKYEKVLDEERRLQTTIEAGGD